ncbi:hypothetical protein [Alteraurantiacibacter aquimixticola]|uniref:Uncharacterized protein n=1 Tax=Alteraurantiacibacter aquimixticola TaxID=2489173 RepID=A0A4T3F296_9SPHN|nr:hypothetical protein [Alteraurantiacibacter aquimixticola]TIX51365.1 hypothetical protein E5222_02550 [Alteraurantiacibacter aquimixticola]
MALDPREILRGSREGIDTAPAPLSGTRAQRIQRLQVGIAGLTVMVLMVGLADIIISSAQQNQVAVPEDLPPVTTQDVPPPPSRDPLADAGVVPNLPAEPEATASPVLAPPDTGDVPPPPASDD